MRGKNVLYINLDPNDLHKVGEDFKLYIWYSKLRYYVTKFKKDKFGFTRVPSYIFREDFGADRMMVWRYNKRLEDKGLIVTDKEHRGGKIGVGFKLL